MPNIDNSTQFTGLCKSSIVEAVEANTGKSLLFFAMHDDRPEALLYLMKLAEKKKVNLTEVKDANGHNIVEYAKNLGHQKVAFIAAGYFKEAAVKQVSNYVQKLPEGNISNLLNHESSTQELQVKNLVEARGVKNADLSYQTLNINNPKNVDLAFKNVDLKGAKINVSSDFGGALDFSGAKLDGAVFSNIIDGERVKVRGADIKFFAYLDKKYFDNLKIQANHKFIVVEGSKAVPSSALNGKSGFEVGQDYSAGLTLEYLKEQIQASKKNLSPQEAEDTFIKSLKDIEEGEAAARIQSYQEFYNPSSKSLNPMKDGGELNKFINDRKDIKYFLIKLCGEHHVALSVLRDDKKAISSYKIYDPAAGIIELDAKSGVATIENIRDLHKKLMNSSDGSIYIQDAQDFMQKAGLIETAQNAYHEERENLHKLYAALKDNDIDAITKFSPIFKIDYLGMDRDGIMKIARFEKDYKGAFPLAASHNPLKFAMYNCSEEALNALVSANKSIDLNSKDNQLFILGHLVKSQKTSDNVLITLINKASELKQDHGKKFFELAKNLFKQGDIKYSESKMKFDYESLGSAEAKTFVKELNDFMHPAELVAQYHNLSE